MKIWCPHLLHRAAVINKLLYLNIITNILRTSATSLVPSSPVGDHRRFESVLWVLSSALTLLVEWQERHPACKKPAAIISKSNCGKLKVAVIMLRKHHDRFMALLPGPSSWAGARRELLDFMAQGKINRGRHTNHLAGRHSIRTNQCPPPPSPQFFYRPDAFTAAQPTVSKHWRQLAHLD